MRFASRVTSPAPFKVPRPRTSGWNTPCEGNFYSASGATVKPKIRKWLTFAGGVIPPPTVASTYYPQSRQLPGERPFSLSQELDGERLVCYKNTRTLSSQLGLGIAMKNVLGVSSFGQTIAFLVPGFVVLLGGSYHSSTIKAWLKIGEGAPAVSGFLFAALASIAAGMAISAVRRLVIDKFIATIFRADKGDLDFAGLSSNVTAFQFVNENHYRYYQYYANMLLAVIIAYVARLTGLCAAGKLAWDTRETLLLLAIIAVEIVLGFGAWDARRKFYQHARSILTAPVTGRRR